eukprot:gene8294-9852_t
MTVNDSQMMTVNDSQMMTVDYLQMMTVDEPQMMAVDDAITFKWMIFSDDDAFFFMPNLLELLEPLDPDVPYIISDDIANCCHHFCQLSKQGHGTVLSTLLPKDYAAEITRTGWGCDIPEEASRRGAGLSTEDIVCVVPTATHRHGVVYAMQHTWRRKLRAFVASNGSQLDAIAMHGAAAVLKGTHLLQPVVGDTPTSVTGSADEVYAKLQAVRGPHREGYTPGDRRMLASVRLANLTFSSGGRPMMTVDDPQMMTVDGIQMMTVDDPQMMTVDGPQMMT